MQASAQPPASGGFGAQPPASGGFGAQPPASGGFGAPASPGGFGGQPPSGGDYGGQPPSGGGYGGQPPGGGSYGQPAALPASAGGGPGSQIDVGDVLRATFEAWKRNLVLLAMVNAVCAVPGWIFSSGGALYQATNMADAGAALVGGGLSLVGVLVSIVCNSVSFGASTRVGLDDLDGRAASSVGDALSFGFSRIATSLVIMFLSWIGVFVGMLLCIVPGVIVSTMISVAMPVAIAESKGGVDALTRSVSLTEGHRLNIFLVYLALAVTMMVLVLPVFCCIGAAAGGAGAAGGSIVAVVITQVLTLGITIAVSGYFQLLAVTLYQRLSGYGGNTDGAAVAQVFR